MSSDTQAEATPRSSKGGEKAGEKAGEKGGEKGGDRHRLRTHFLGPAGRPRHAAAGRRGRAGPAVSFQLSVQVLGGFTQTCGEEVLVVFPFPSNAQSHEANLEKVAEHCCHHSTSEPTELGLLPAEARTPRPSSDARQAPRSSPAQRHPGVALCLLRSKAQCPLKETWGAGGRCED